MQKVLFYFDILKELAFDGLAIGSLLFCSSLFLRCFHAHAHPANVIRFIYIVKSVVGMVATNEKESSSMHAPRPLFSHPPWLEFGLCVCVCVCVSVCDSSRA